jgi:hypothetical protein
MECHRFWMWWRCQRIVRPTDWLAVRLAQLGDKRGWEFSDEHGRAYAVGPCQEVDLLVLHYVPEAA